MVVLTTGFILQSITIKKHISLMPKLDFRQFFVYISYVLCVCIRMYACVTCMYPCATRMLSVCYPYVVRVLPVCCPYVTRMFFVCYPYVVRMFFVCCPYVTRMYPCVSVWRYSCVTCRLPVCPRVLF